MKKIAFLFLLVSSVAFAQMREQKIDTTETKYLIIEGDSIPKTSIDLEEVMLLHKL